MGRHWDHAIKIIQCTVMEIKFTKKCAGLFSSGQAAVGSSDVNLFQMAVLIIDIHFIE